MNCVSSVHFFSATDNVENIFNVFIEKYRNQNGDGEIVLNVYEVEDFQKGLGYENKDFDLVRDCVPVVTYRWNGKEFI